MMQKSKNITQLSTGIILVIILSLVQFTLVFAMEKCGESCKMHDHMQKKEQTCCHAEIVKVSMSSSAVCSAADNLIIVHPAVKTQLKRLSSFKDLSSNALYLAVTSESPSLYGSLYILLPVHAKYNETAIYLLDSVSLS